MNNPIELINRFSGLQILEADESDTLRYVIVINNLIIELIASICII